MADTARALLRRWWFTLTLLGVLLGVALLSSPVQTTLSAYYYYVALPLISR